MKNCNTPAKNSEADASSTSQLVFRMLSFLRPVWKTALIASLIVIVRIAVEIPGVYFLSPAITTLSKKISTNSENSGFFSWIFGSSNTAHDLRWILLWMALSQLALGIMVYLRSVWDTKLSMRAVYHIRGAVYDRLQNVSFSFHDQMSSGQLINRALSDLQCVRQFVNTSLLSTLDITVSIAAYFGLLFFRSPWMALAAFLPLPFWWVVINRFSSQAQPIYRSQQEASDKLMNSLTENLAGVHVVKAFGLEKSQIKKYQGLNEVLLSRLFKMVKLQSRLTPTLKAIATGAHVLLFILASYLVHLGKMTVGDIMILGIAMGTILNKLQQVNQIIEVYQKAVVSARRLFEILDTPPVTIHEQKSLPAEFKTGEITFENIDFGYDPKQPILKKVSATIPGHKVTAIVGPTGCGKTTLAGLIARFYDPQKGSIKIDGQDLLDVSLKDLRHQVGYVFQETFLFTDSVRNNIRYGRMDVSEEMLHKAAKAAHADEFIKALPQGYDTRLGEGGVMLSGGQRQRLALARALVYDPKILILDDAMAALDHETEHAIHSMINPLFEGKTVIIIAHRLSSVQHADHVLVLKNGQVEESGTHSDLLQQDGHYREILRMYLGECKAPLLLELDGAVVT